MKRLNKYYTDSLSNTSWGPVPWYAMDKQEIYRLKPGQRKTESLKKENRFRWDRGRCKWARPTDIQINPFS